MASWFEVFPALRALTIASDDIRFHDAREWDHNYRYQRFGRDFSGEALATFVADVLGPHIPVDRSGALVINVRRGDYFADAAAEARFGFDQVGYIRDALGRVSGASRILVVSDDDVWCRAELGGDLTAAAAEVDYAPPDPQANFLAVAGARKIIGTNSTFSYWGAYVACVLQGDAEIVMPQFHARTSVGTDAYQLDPRWIAIEGYA
ncbi:alpha-1,2-fucosyltransferase [Microbacterium lacus]|uniref:alpha-1,2-fucosyltransferase n=1 Tax=Microbacterium lacus TaxID=415217 RepID=UPI00384C8598